MLKGFFEVLKKYRAVTVPEKRFAIYQSAVWMLSCADALGLYLLLRFSQGRAESQLAVFAIAFAAMVAVTLLKPRRETSGCLFSLAVTSFNLVFCLFIAMMYYRPFIAVAAVQMLPCAVAFILMKLYGKAVPNEYSQKE